MSSDVSFNPRTGAEHGSVAHSSPAAVEALLAAAHNAAAAVAQTTPRTRMQWLEAIAQTLLQNQDELVRVADEETGLGDARLRGELTKCAASILFYGEVGLDGGYLNASFDTIDPTLTLGRWNVPLGPIAVYPASNFPFGFGVAGHDLASALSAGCPVLIKAHSAQPRLGVLLGQLVQTALHSQGAPAGTFGVVVGYNAGLQLIDSPAVTAVSFTGGQPGGMAIFQRCAARGIPVFAEMGTVNPAFVTPTAAASRTAEIAAGFVGSFTLGAGQFCTKPGLLFAPSESGMFEAVQSIVDGLAPAPLLTARMAASYRQGIDEMSHVLGVPSPASDVVAAAVTTSDGTSLAQSFDVAPHVFRISVNDLLTQPVLLEECFGPVALVCEYDDVAEALGALRTLQPSLAGSVFSSGDDDNVADIAVTQLISQTGRVALNAWTTGVATSWSMQHGGPWPATSNAQATSVGAGALARFVRPVALQNPSPSQLPPALHPANPWGITRRIDGILVLAQPSLRTNPKENKS
jgi:NADP-dependent aldehyde dehydrogenase